MTEETKMPQYDNTHRLTLSEVKDSAYARMCRRGTLLVLTILIVYLALMGLYYYLVRQQEETNTRPEVVLYMIIGYVPIIIGGVIYNFVNLRRLYANYENFQLVTCEIWNASMLDFGGQTLMRNDQRNITHYLTFTTVDGVEHKVTSQKVKKFAMIAVIQLDRYKGSAQFLYDAQKDVLYPFTPLPPIQKNK